MLVYVLQCFLPPLGNSDHVVVSVSIDFPLGFIFLLMLVYVLPWFLPPLGNSDHVVASVSIDFPSNSKWDTSFHCRAYNYSHADCDGLCDHLRNI